MKRPKYSLVEKAVPYNLKKSRTLWTLRLLPDPLRDLNPGTSAFAIAVMVDQFHFGFTNGDLDGRLGPRTLGKYKELYGDKGHNLSNPEDKMEWVNLPADEWEGRGYDNHLLRQDAAKAYMRVYDVIHARGGVITSSGSKRRLTSDVGANRSATSLHYIGRALDLYMYSAMIDPDTDPYVVTKDPDRDRHWIVYARVPIGDEMELEAWTRKADSQKTTGMFMNLTELFAEHGFDCIPARSSFFSGNNFGGSEWWHFQYETGLQRGDLFGSELLRIYDLEELEGTPPWEYRDRAWGINWG